MPNRLLRFSAAMVLLFYGFAKINGSQFTILDSELDKPMGQVSGFWLTWYYFGFSAFYGNFIALMQIAGALLLTFRRTTLLGACILAPILANIVLIDVFYRIDLGATLVAFGLLAMMLILIAPRAVALRAVFLPPQPPPVSGTFGLAKWSVRLSMLVIACGVTYWVANYNNRSPTPIDGTWDVASFEPESAAAQIPATLFFEYNRAGMVVFKAWNGTYETHHFEVEPNTRHLRIWQSWLSKGQQIFDGGFTLAGTGLDIDGSLNNSAPVKLHLLRRESR